MKRFLSCTLAALFFFCAALPAGAQVEDLTRLTAADADAVPLFGAGCFSVLLMEQSTGTVLYESNADAMHPIASVTKIMTVLLVAEAIDTGIVSLTDTVTVSENAAGKGGSQIYLEPGETMSVQELLKAVVVASANDGAVALGEHLSGSESAFVARMNERADELGLKTRFVNPTGLDDDECHESTAREVAILSRELLRHEWITEYTTIWMDTVRGGAFGLTNTNRLVRFYEGTTGLKTGSTSKAGYCISASARRGELHLIAVVLGGESSDRRFSAAKELLDYGFATFALYTPKTTAFDPIRVWGGKTDAVKPQSTPEGILVKKADAARITEEVLLPADLTAPVEAGQTVGEIAYSLDGEEIARHPILASEGVEEAGFWYIFARLIRQIVFGG